MIPSLSRVRGLAFGRTSLLPLLGPRTEPLGDDRLLRRRQDGKRAFENENPALDGRGRGHGESTAAMSSKALGVLLDSGRPRGVYLQPLLMAHAESPQKSVLL